MDATSIGATVANRWRVPQVLALAERALVVGKGARSSMPNRSRTELTTSGIPSPHPVRVAAATDDAGHDDRASDSTTSKTPSANVDASLSRAQTSNPTIAKIKFLDARISEVAPSTGKVGARNDAEYGRAQNLGQPRNSLQKAADDSRSVGEPALAPASNLGSSGSIIKALQFQPDANFGDLSKGAFLKPRSDGLQNASSGYARSPSVSREAGTVSNGAITSPTSHFAKATRPGGTAFEAVPAQSRFASLAGGTFSPPAKLAGAAHTADQQSSAAPSAAAASPLENGVNGTTDTDGSSRSGPNGPIEGDVYLDGTLMGRWVMRALAAEAGLPSSGNAAFDPRRAAFPSGPMIGG